MSVVVMSWVLKHSEESVPGRRLVLLSLADKADHDGTGAYPSVQTIANECRMSTRGVQYALRALEESGQIEKRGMHPIYGTNEWAVIMGVQPLQGRNLEQEGVKPSSPEPSIEPSSGVENARAKADKVPDDFPNELSHHHAKVLYVLDDVARQHNCPAPTKRGLALAMMHDPHKPFVELAYEMASWAADPPRPIKDVVATYRTFLKRTRSLAGVENLDARTSSGKMPSNVKQFTPRPKVSGRVTGPGSPEEQERRMRESFFGLPGDA